MDGDGNDKDYHFSVYVNTNRERRENKKDLDLELLEEIIKDLKPVGPRRITKTWCGYIASFVFERDANDLLNTSLEEAFGPTVKVAKFSAKDIRNKQVLLLRDVPGAVPLQEVKVCLEKQGIFPVKIERQRQNVKLEVADGTNYETLLRNGLDFFGITRFSAVPERWRRPNLEMPQDSVIQCYRCQNFWHIAAHCSLPPRCVRCGGPHSVETCTRPRNDPFCCHCGGPHHAAYRHCPVRLQVSTSPLAYPIPVRGCSR